MVSSVFSSPPLGKPPIETGCAAPIVVAGAIAAILAAMVMKQPALVAVAPVGSHINDDRHRRAEKALHNLLRQSSKPPGVLS